MRWLVLTVSALAQLSSPWTAAAEGASPGSEVETEFELAASHGFEAEVEARDGSVTLAIKGERRVFYQAEGVTSQRSLEADFGRVGRISLAFEPTKTLRSTKPPAGCRGEPHTAKEGFFVGEIEFRGEGGYATIDRRRVHAEVSTDPPWHCHRAQEHAGRRVPPVRHRKRIGVLLARSPDNRVRFVAIAAREHHGVKYENFAAIVFERREGTRIGRYDYFSSQDRISDFRYSHEKGVAALHPPAPFSGRAGFRRSGAGHAGTLRGSLTADFLGRGPVRLCGPGWTASLSRRAPADE